jgi:hypothetical protein
MNFHDHETQRGCRLLIGITLLIWAVIIGLVLICIIGD